MGKIFIKDGFLINPYDQREGVADITIRTDDESVRIIDAKGKWVVPGLTDLHTHFRDPGFTHKEDINSGLTAATRGGFATVVTMANTSPVTDSPEKIAYQIRKSQERKLAMLLPVSSVTKNMDGKELVDWRANLRAGAAAFSEDGKAVEDSDLFEKFMRELSNEQIPILTHCDGEKGEEYYVERDIALAKKTGAKLHIQHVSLAGSVELIREAKKKLKNLTAEATPHHFCLNADALKLHGPNAKMSPPLRTETDRQAIIQGLQDGTIDVIATDHAPHDAEGKASNNPPNGIIGLETAVGLSLTELYHTGKLREIELIKKFTKNPASIIHQPSYKYGTFTVIDPNMEWTVDSNEFASKSKNMPYDGMKLRGRATHTIRNGEIIHEL